MESVKVEADTEYTLPECGFTAPMGKVFVKWDLGKAGDKITVNADTILIAEWKSKVNVADIFDDIQGDEWFVPYVQFVYDNGVMSGKGRMFDPNGKIRREEITQIIYSHAGKPELSANDKNPFTDVKDNQWFCKGIVWCYKNSIVGGVGNNRFGVGQNVKRQDLVLMLYKYAQTLGLKSLNNVDENAYIGYKDTKQVDSYAIPAMNWAITNGLIGGKGTPGAPKSELRLDPKGNATRAEGATIIMQFMSEE